MSRHDYKPYPEECERIRELLGARVDGPLAPGEEVRLNDHLEECEDCHAVASWMSSVDTLAHGVRAADAPDSAYFEGVRTAVMDEVRQAAAAPSPASSARRWWRWPMLAPAVLAVAVVGLFTMRQSHDTEVLDTVGQSVPERRQALADGRGATTDEGAGDDLVEEREASAEQAPPDASPKFEPITPRAPEMAKEAAPGATEPALGDEGKSSTKWLAQNETPRALKSVIQAAPEVQPASGLARLDQPLASTGADEAPTLQGAYLLAVRSQGTPGEPAAIDHLLDLLEKDLEKEKKDEEAAERVRAMAYTTEPTRAAPAAADADSTRTLDEAIADYLSARRDAIDDAALRERIEAWLDSR